MISPLRTLCNECAKSIRVDVPLEETMGALVHAVRQGEALYVGISSSGPERTCEAARILKSKGVPLLIHQPLLNDEPLAEKDLLGTLGEWAWVDDHNQLNLRRAARAEYSMHTWGRRDSCLS